MVDGQEEIHDYSYHKKRLGQEENIRMRLALFQPDIAQNTGAIIRLCACLGVPLDVIEPCGFVFDDEKLRRVGMDYIDHVDITRHFSWQHFLDSVEDSRLILLSTKSSGNYTEFSFAKSDILLLGRESAGVPAEVAARCDGMVKIPMRGEVRSLNVAMAGAIILSEALRQTELL